MLIRETDEMVGMDLSSSYQLPPTPSCPPSTYHQSTFSSYQPSSMTAPNNPQQLSPSQGSIQTSYPQIQQMAPAATANFQPESHQQSNASFPMFNTILPSTAAFPTPSTPASLPVNQLTTEVPAHLMTDSNAKLDKSTIIKRFSELRLE